MKQIISSIIAVVVLVALIWWLWPSRTVAPVNPPTASSTAEIIVTSPVANSVVTSPLVVTGKAVGNWYFEASFPIELQDSTGKVLAQIPAQAQGDWMTTDYVPFSASLGFAKPATPTGMLILKNDNPSGDPAKDKSITIPVKFQ